MPFYIGKSVDGSDMEECHGGYINPDNENEFSSVPYPKQRKLMRNRQTVFDYMSCKYTLQDVYNSILNKTCPLSSSLRDYVVSHFDANGIFIES